MVGKRVRPRLRLGLELELGLGLELRREHQLKCGRNIGSGI